MFNKCEHSKGISKNKLKLTVALIKLYICNHKKYYDRYHVQLNFEIGDPVIFEDLLYENIRKLSQIFSGPYQILKKLSDFNFEIVG